MVTRSSTLGVKSTFKYLNLNESIDSVFQHHTDYHSRERARVTLGRRRVGGFQSDLHPTHRLYGKRTKPPRTTDRTFSDRERKGRSRIDSRQRNGKWVFRPGPRVGRDRHKGASKDTQVGGYRLGRQGHRSRSGPWKDLWVKVRAYRSTIPTSNGQIV